MTFLKFSLNEVKKNKVLHSLQLAVFVGLVIGLFIQVPKLGDTVMVANIVIMVAGLLCVSVTPVMIFFANYQEHKGNVKKKDRLMLLVGRGILISTVIAIGCMIFQMLNYP